MGIDIVLSEEFERHFEKEIQRHFDEWLEDYRRSEEFFTKIDIEVKKGVSNAAVYVCSNSGAYERLHLYFTPVLASDDLRFEIDIETLIDDAIKEEDSDLCVTRDRLQIMLDKINKALEK